MPRTKNHLLTVGIWKSITAAAKNSRKPSYVAVAYFGRGASKLLPLRANSRLVVDASDNAVKAGQTHPADLKRLQRRGVIIYSVANLHAKIYVFDSTAFVGSANVSNNSAGTLIESMVSTTDPGIMRSAKSFVDSLRLDELSPGTLDRLQKIYRPPRLPKGMQSKRRRKTTRNTQTDLRRLFLTQLVRGEPPAGSEAVQEKGLRAAKSRRKHGRTYVLQDFFWGGNAPFQRGDKVIQVIKEEDGRRLIDAPADIIHTQRWRRNERRVMFVYLEMPKVRRISLEKLARRLGYGAKKKLHRNGLVRNREFAEVLYENWKLKS
jgi:PLD-like domain